MVKETLAEEIERIWNKCDRKLNEYVKENEAMREWILGNAEHKNN